MPYNLSEVRNRSNVYCLLFISVWQYSPVSLTDPLWLILENNDRFFRYFRNWKIIKKLIDNGSIKEVGEFDLGLGLVTYYQETFRREFIHLQICICRILLWFFTEISWLWLSFGCLVSFYWLDFDRYNS